MTVHTLSKVITITPDLAADSVAATTPYGDKDVIGDLITLTDVLSTTKGSCVLQSLVLKSKVTTANLYDIIFFSEAPAGVTGDNNSVCALTDSDLSKIVGIVSVAAADHNAFCSNFTVAVKTNIGLVMQGLASTRNLYALVIARGAVTFGAIGDLKIDLGFLQD